ncbi:MAG: uridine kinase family protein [Cytophaga sp.]|uniref:uridine kinase family protein n=1 Tax=Cytophaga sp. TaxID=29535 RepID=UPI003F812D1A
MKPPLVIGICGGSASGKTYLKDMLLARAPEGKVVSFTLDSYYLPRDWQKKDENGYLNFDLPEALNTQKMIYDFLDLTNGFSIEQPVYQYKISPPSLDFRIIEPAPVIIAEGIFLFHYKEIRERIDAKVFIDAPFDVKRKRRIERDIRERGYELSEIEYRFDNHARDSYNQYVLPYQQEADYEVTDDDSFEKTFNELLNRILAY